MGALDVLPVTTIGSGGPVRNRATSNPALPQLGTVEASAYSSSFPYIVQVGKLRRMYLDLLECHAASLIP